MALVHINIGSNLGNREENISAAIAEIALYSDTIPVISTIIETEPWGYESRNRFLNVGVNITTNINPEYLLKKIQETERSISTAAHRNPDGSYADRAIDIDLIFVDRLCMASETLILPHPRLHLRRFVLQPMKEISADWIHPKLHLSAAQMLARLNDLQPGIR